MFSSVPGECNLIPGLDQAAKDLIVKKHNTARSYIANGWEASQPSAANMREMVWNEELAKIAQDKVQNCQANHFQDLTGFKGERMGVNFGYLNFPAVLPAEVIGNYSGVIVMDWLWRGVELFDKSKIKPFVYSESTRDYSQIVYADAHEVGCGVAMFDDRLNFVWID